MSGTEPDARQVPDGLRRHLRQLFAERIGLKLTALFVSLLLWFVVHFVRFVETAP